jgi:hypothetical protein
MFGAAKGTMSTRFGWFHRLTPFAEFGEVVLF